MMKENKERAQNKKDNGILQKTEYEWLLEIQKELSSGGVHL